MQAGQYQYRTLPQVVAEAATAYGERVAITDGDVLLSYTELNAPGSGRRAFIAAGLEKRRPHCRLGTQHLPVDYRRYRRPECGGAGAPEHPAQGAEAAYIYKPAARACCLRWVIFWASTIPNCCGAMNCRHWTRLCCCRGGRRHPVLGGLPGGRGRGCRNHREGAAALTPMIPWTSCSPPAPPASPRGGDLPRPEYPHLRDLERHRGSVL